MNDLEHDLHELFQRKAQESDPSVLAPTDVLRRGRRRQARTVVTGAAAGVLAIAVAVAAIGVVRRPDVVMPVGQQPVPARTTSIGGVPVTAPAGWTLVDDWPLSAVLATTSESCTFSATGIPVGQSGSSIESAPTGGVQPQQSCTSEPTSLPAGAPVLQLANFKIPLMETVCGLAGEVPTSLPSNGVAVYVGAFPGGLSTGTFQAACPGSENIASGDSVMTFADRGVQTAYGAIVVAGPAASADDVASAQRYLASLDGLRVSPTAPASVAGPGYVVAAGDANGRLWRLEAGITFAPRSGGSTTFHLGASLVTTDNDSEGSETVDVPSGSDPVAESALDLGDAGVVQWGTATDAVTGVDIVADDGSSAAATLFAWSAIGESSAGLPALPGGSVWFAAVPVRGTVQPHLISDPTSSPDPSEAPGAQQLQTTVDSDGRYTVFGNDFGHDWSFHQERRGGLLFYLDGVEQEGFSSGAGGGTQFDIPGGTLKLVLQPKNINRIWVTSDVQGTQVVAEGQWAPPAAYAAVRANIWVVALPGGGNGFSWEDDRALPLAIDWPTVSPPSPGDQIGAGGTRDVSFVQYWSGQDCPMLDVVAATSSGDIGTSGCPIAWDAKTDPHQVSYIGGVYGTEHAVVIMTGPDAMLADVTSQDDPKAGGSCAGGSVANVGAWAHTGQCIFVIPVGETWVVQPTRMDRAPFGGTITITAKAGSLDVRGDAPSPGA